MYLPVSSWKSAFELASRSRPWTTSPEIAARRPCLIVTRSAWTRPPSMETSSSSTRVSVARTLPIESTEPSRGYVKEPLPAAASSFPSPVRTCGVCRTDLHIFDGELTHPKLPLVLGHQIVGTVVGETRRVGIPWLGWTDGECRFCRSGRENLCDNARFTGYDLDGGYAEYT